MPLALRIVAVCRVVCEGCSMLALEEREWPETVVQQFKLVASEQMFRVMFAVDARTNCEAISISPKNKTVDLRNVTTGEITTESYDKLVLSPGAPSVHPDLPGIDLPGIFHVRTCRTCGRSVSGSRSRRV